MTKLLIISYTFLFASIADAGEVNHQSDQNHPASPTGGWTSQPTGLAGATLLAVSAVNMNVSWIAGASGTIIRTLDGGITWSLIDPGIIRTEAIDVIVGVSDSIALVETHPTDTTFIYRTSDGGSSW